MELVNGDPSDQDALEVQVFGDDSAAQSEVGVDMRPSLQGSDDGVVIEVQDLDLLAVLLACLPHPVLGLLGPSGAVVAENEPDSRDVAIQNQRADLRFVSALLEVLRLRNGRCRAPTAAAGGP